MIAVPLAINASWMSQQWWAFIPLAGGAWWYADRSWPWTWIVAVEAGAFGTLWSYSYACALAFFDNSRPLVFAIWAAMALSLTLVSLHNRRHNGSSPSYPGY